MIFEITRKTTTQRLNPIHHRDWNVWNDWNNLLKAIELESD